MELTEEMQKYSKILTDGKVNESSEKLEEGWFGGNKTAAPEHKTFAQGINLAMTVVGKFYGNLQEPQKSQLKPLFVKIQSALQSQVKNKQVTEEFVDRRIEARAPGAEKTYKEQVLEKYPNAKLILTRNEVGASKGNYDCVSIITLSSDADNSLLAWKWAAEKISKES